MRPGSVDWCEHNYVWSPYIAEWWNTWSNVVPLALSAWAVVALNRAGWRRTQPWEARVAYLCPLVVFMGSFWFHATLTYAGQLADEIPMIYGALWFHVAISDDKPRAWRRGGAVGAAITATMIALRASPLPLQLSYGALVVSLVGRSALLARGDAFGARVLRFAAAVYALGFALWLADQHFCDAVRPLHGHALWHLLGGLGTLAYVQFIAAHTLQRQKREPAWGEAAGGLPLVLASV